nr:immunoglobulin heavy chain junction region [Mus musculus]MBK4183702.1 immunoglobulin heavy chain junction region [Mus musculus]MBK4183703.1 immunoglobulin heavy chain junction region [Mus musculus]MBK4183916.1 immunoglobulin heavy chain junction region [Mus musculus]MBK4185004.1 immunoglobulin heavy chain junction region [Mus musculus]
CARDFDVW